MPNWVFCVLEVSAKSRKPKKKADAKLWTDELGRVSDLSAFMDAAWTPSDYLGIHEKGDGIPFDFEAFIPTPMELYDHEKICYPLDHPERAAYEAKINALAKKYGSGTAYDFHCDQWGTKWNACDGELDTIVRRINKAWPTDKGISTSTTKHSCVYRFNTAWSPPVPVILAASKAWPMLTFELDCEEEANMFDPFTATFKGGKMVKEITHEPEVDEDEEDGDE